MDAFSRDLRHALRALARRPGFAAVVAATLALGLGANAAIFTVVNAVLLRPPPFPEAERLVAVWETVRRETTERRELSYPDFADLRVRGRSFRHLAAYDSLRVTVAGDGANERPLAERVSPDYFAAVGVEPSAGRVLAAGKVGEPVREVVIGHGLWQRRYGGDPRVVGQSLRIGEVEHTIVGVMPRTFAGLSDTAELWLPITGLPRERLENRGSRFLRAVGRLASGVSLEQARGELTILFRQLEEIHPEDNRGYGATAVPLSDELRGDLRRPLTLLLAAVGFVLLIACTNVANLLLARVASRRRENALRAALGASRARIVGPLLAEILLLSLAGGLMGLLLAAWGIDLLAAWIPVELPSFVAVAVDGRVLGFTLALSLTTGFLLGLAAAWSATGLENLESLRGGDARGSTSGMPQKRFRSLLVVAELALALLLLIGAGLMARSFQGLQRIEPGFDAENLLFFRYDHPDREAEPAAIAAEGRDRRRRLAALPGVEGAALGSDTPLSGSRRATVISSETLTHDPAAPYGGGVRAYWHRVSPGFFATLGLPLLGGRDFGPEDEGESSSSVIVSAALARRLWPGEDPLGQRVKPGSPDREAPWLTVVGVAAEVRYRDLALSALMRRELAALDPGAVAYSLQTIDQRLAAETARSRFSTLLMGLFAGLALLLAGIGIYGVMTYSVGHRRREIGIRMALGAPGGRVVALIIGQGMLLVLAGAVLGLLGAFGLTRFLASLLHEVSASDPWIYLGMTATLAAVALLGCYLPARRASRVDPVAVLHEE